MKLRKTFLMGMLGTCLLNSCSSDDDPITPEPQIGAYSEGIFVLNQGSQAAGTISYISNDLGTVENEIYQTNNEGDLGIFLQSMFFNQDKAYIISNGSNLITVVDRNTFELLGKVESGLAVPYYAAVVNGKAYVSNLSSFDTTNDDYIAVVDLETLEVVETIELDGPADNVITDDQYVYVQNSSFGTGNSITVIDPATNAVIETIMVNDGLTAIDIENDILYVLSSGGFQTVDLGTRQVVGEVTFPENLQGVSKLDVEEGTSYFTLSNKVYAMPVGATAAPTDALLEYTSESQYGMMYAFEVENDRVYIGDAGDFASDGFVQVYSKTGDLLEQISVGVGPAGFYFNE